VIITPIEAIILVAVLPPLIYVPLALKLARRFNR
jgi:hypothetical protein